MFVFKLLLICHPERSRFVISSVVERSLHALRLVEMTNHELRLVEMTGGVFAATRESFYSHTWEPYFDDAKVLHLHCG